MKAMPHVGHGIGPDRSHFHRIGDLELLVQALYPSLVQGAAKTVVGMREAARTRELTLCRTPCRRSRRARHRPHLIARPIKRPLLAASPKRYVIIYGGLIEKRPQERAQTKERPNHAICALQMTTSPLLYIMQYTLTETVRSIDAQFHRSYALMVIDQE